MKMSAIGISAKRALALLISTLCSLGIAASVQAQTTDNDSNQFWPEIDVYWRLKPNVRAFFMVSRTKETGRSTETEFGAHIDVFVKRLVKLKQVAGLQIDESKESLLMLRAGYHFVASSGNVNEQRLVFEATPRLPLVRGAVVSIRNRAELRFQDKFSWRYRNRGTIEKEVAIGSYHITPYARAEFYYDSNPSKWSRTAVAAGSILPIRKRWELDVYFEHQNDTGGSSNRQINAVGVALAYHR